jgi:hypothetical protein
MSIEEIKKKLGELYLNAEECKKDNQVITNVGVENWYKATQEYISKGLDFEEAGKKAAQELFGKYFQDNTLVIKRYVQAATEQFSNIRKSHTQSVMVLMQELESLMKK